MARLTHSMDTKGTTTLCCEKTIADLPETDLVTLGGTVTCKGTDQKYGQVHTESALRGRLVLALSFSQNPIVSKPDGTQAASLVADLCHWLREIGEDPDEVLEHGLQFYKEDQELGR